MAVASTSRINPHTRTHTHTHLHTPQVISMVSTVSRLSTTNQIVRRRLRVESAQPTAEEETQLR